MSDADQHGLEYEKHFESRPWRQDEEEEDHDGEERPVEGDQ